MITEELKNQIDEDIKLCEEAIDGKAQSLYKVYSSLKSKYIGLIDDFDKGLTDYPGTTLSLMNNIAGDGISKILSRLKVFKANNYSNFKKENNVVSSYPNINITNSNENNVNFNFDFDTVIESIKNNESLDDDSIAEIVEKINELKEIQQSNDSKKSNWNKVKKIILWLADKGVDVAIQLLPLLFASIK